MAVMKYASRSTIKKLSRAEVESRIDLAHIVLPAITGKLPVWWHDEFDPFLDYGWNNAEATNEEAIIDEATWNAAHRAQQHAWTLAQTSDKEHPSARAFLFTHGLTVAVKRAGLDQLNSIIKTKLMDEEHLPIGLRLWKHWDLRTATRLMREKAVIEVLGHTSIEKEEKA